MSLRTGIGPWPAGQGVGGSTFLDSLPARTARLMKQDDPNKSFPEIARVLEPDAYAVSPRKAGEAIRRGVERLGKVQTKLPS